MALTDTALRKFKTPEKPTKLSDGQGLYLHVKPSGVRAWRFDYRYLGTRKTLTIGRYPDVSLADARNQRDDAKKLLAKNIDPGAQKKRDFDEAKARHDDTFKRIAEDYIELMRANGRAEITIRKNEWMILKLASRLHNRPITEIKAREILPMLKRIEKDGRVESAIATRAAIGRVFRFAISAGKAEADPTPALRGALREHTPTGFAALTVPMDVAGLLRATWDYDGWPTLGALLRMQAYVFQRPGETRTMMWQELDLEKNVWFIPKEKTKSRRPHDVPLSRQALVVIDEMSKYENGNGYVFPSMMSGKKTLSENSMNSALRRMGIRNDQHTAHGFRSTASTRLNESGEFDSRWIEAQLAHLDPNKVSRIYNRADYWDERVTMMQWWADYLDKLRTA